MICTATALPCAGRGGHRVVGAVRFGNAQRLPKALSDRQSEQALALHASGESVVDMASSFRVGRDTVYRVIRAAVGGGENNDQLQSFFSSPLD